MAYGWDMPGDSAFNNTVFMNYKVFNRSQQTYFNTYLGMFTDIDIGNWLDDYIGCDVYRASYYGFNGKAIDGSGLAHEYGAHPPAQSVTFLAGPKMDSTGSDRPRVDGSGHQLCNESINGVGFGDGIPDNERIGLSHFIRTSAPLYGGPSYMYDPGTPRSYYNFLRSIWGDSTLMIYGGLGHSGFGGYGPPCRYMYTGESDTLNWGVGCQVPNGQKNWTEKIAGAKPNDIKGVGSVGPFTFRPGEMKELDLAFVFARDYTSPDTLASVTKLMQMIDIVRHAFVTNKLPGGGSFTSVNELPVRQSTICTVYPNPAASLVHIVFNIPPDEPATLGVYDGQGRMIRSQILAAGTTGTLMDVAGLPEGLYLLVMQSSTIIVVRKLAVIR